MAFKSASEITKRVQRVGPSGEDLTMTTDTQATKSNGERSYSLRFGVSMALLKEARIMEGDRVDLLFDEEARLGLIKRVTAGGWAVGRRTSTSSKITIQLTWAEGLPSVSGPSACESVSVTDEGILFVLPTGAQFGPCARAEESTDQ